MPGMFKEQWGKVSEGEASNKANPKRLGATDTQHRPRDWLKSGRKTFLRLKKEKQGREVCKEKGKLKELVPFSCEVVDTFSAKQRQWKIKPL